MKRITMAASVLALAALAFAALGVVEAARRSRKA